MEEEITLLPLKELKKYSEIVVCGVHTVGVRQTQVMAMHALVSETTCERCAKCFNN